MAARTFLYKPVMANYSIPNGAGISPLLTASEAALILGVHRRTVSRLAACGVLPSVWFGNRRRFALQHLEALAGRGYGQRAAGVR